MDVFYHALKKVTIANQQALNRFEYLVTKGPLLCLFLSSFLNQKNRVQKMLLRRIFTHFMKKTPDFHIQHVRKIVDNKILKLKFCS